VAPNLAPIPSPIAPNPVSAPKPAAARPTPSGPSRIQQNENAEITKLKTQVEELTILLQGFWKSSKDQLTQIEEIKYDNNMADLSGDNI
jgi:hypothetical protein